MVYIITQDGMQSIPFEESNMLYTRIGDPMVGKFNIYIQDTVYTDRNIFIGAYKTAKRTKEIIKNLTLKKADDVTNLFGPSDSVFIMPEEEE